MNQTSVGTGTESDFNENPAPHGYPHKTLGAELNSSPGQGGLPAPAGAPGQAAQPYPTDQTGQTGQTGQTEVSPALAATSFSVLTSAIPPLAPGEAVASSELLSPDELLASLNGPPQALSLEAFPDAPNAGPGPSALEAARGESRP